MSVMILTEGDVDVVVAIAVKIGQIGHANADAFGRRLREMNMACFQDAHPDLVPGFCGCADYRFHDPHRPCLAAAGGTVLYNLPPPETEADHRLWRILDAVEGGLEAFAKSARLGAQLEELQAKRAARAAGRLCLECASTNRWRCAFPGAACVLGQASD